VSPLRSAPYYWAECDACGANLQAGEFSAWAQDDVPLDEVTDNGGLAVRTDDGYLVVCVACCSSYVGLIATDEDAGEEEWERLRDDQPDALGRLVAWLESRKSAV
jgi:hypothetical protein